MNLAETASTWRIKTWMDLVGEIEQIEKLIAPPVVNIMKV